MFRFLSLTILAWLIFRWLDRFFGGRSGSNPKTAQKQKEPKEKKASSSKIPKDVGEYVDYVEVKDNKKKK
ncbi:hypothetical protein OAV76_05245 [Schleiferiaceae bacterium]|nr:hypothetical protein [Schleiferiaceae bacterium]